MNANEPAGVGVSDHDDDEAVGGREGQQGAQLPLADGGHEQGGAQAPPPVGARRQATTHGRHGGRGAHARTPAPWGEGSIGEWISELVNR